jgi:hypothetical protein
MRRAIPPTRGATALLLTCLRPTGPRPDGAAAGAPASGASPYARLVAEIEALGYAAVGRNYGVSGNAIRKWRRAYEAEDADTHGVGRPRAEEVTPTTA